MGSLIRYPSGVWGRARLKTYLDEFLAAMNKRSVKILSLCSKKTFHPKLGETVPGQNDTGAFLPCPCGVGMSE